MKRTAGHTLIELIVYFALSLAALGILTSLVRVVRRTGDHTYAQYLVSGNMATTIRMIRKELQATSLASVNAYGSKGGLAPGFSCVSAYDDKGEFQMSAYGTPHWQKHVYYSLAKDGKITRWTTDLEKKNFLPSLASDPSAPDSATARVLMSDALAPNQAVAKWHDATPYGGLEVNFVQRSGGNETLSQENPRDAADKAQITGLIEVALRILESNGPNFMEVKFRVAPRY